MMRKTLFVSALILSVIFSGCGQKAETAEQAAQQTPAAEKTESTDAGDTTFWDKVLNGKEETSPAPQEETVTHKEEAAATEAPAVQAEETAAEASGTDASEAGVEELAAEAENKSSGVPHRIELVQSVQEKTHYGGAAVVQMILRSHGIEKAQADLADELHTSTVTGTEYADAARVLNTYLFNCEVPGPADPGYRVEYLTPGAVGSSVIEKMNGRIVRDVRTSDPIIIAINTNVLYPNLPEANHFVLITGYKTVNDVITEYYIVDPSPDVQNSEYGGLKLFTVEEIRRAFDTNSEPAYIW